MKFIIKTYMKNILNACGLVYRRSLLFLKISVVIKGYYNLRDDNKIKTSVFALLVY